MSDDEDALLQKALPRNLLERKRAIAVRSAEESVKVDRTEKTVYELIYAIGLTNSIKKEFPMSFKILEKLFVEKYPIDETQPDKINGITDSYDPTNRNCGIKKVRTRWICNVVCDYQNTCCEDSGNALSDKSRKRR